MQKKDRIKMQKRIEKFELIWKLLLLIPIGIPTARSQSR